MSKSRERWRGADGRGGGFGWTFCGGRGIADGAAAGRAVWEHFLLRARGSVSLDLLPSCAFLVGCVASAAATEGGESGTSCNQPQASGKLITCV